MPGREAFWKTKSLEEMTPEEWESLCDRCGICCLNKVQEEDTGKLLYTNVACYLLDLDTCLCNNYERRKGLVPDCRKLTPDLIREISWLPATCAYRLIEEGKGLEWWHPLVSETPSTVRIAGISLQGKIVSGDCICDDRLAEYVIDWIVV